MIRPKREKQQPTQPNNSTKNGLPKILVLGQTSVGKTSLLFRLTNARYSSEELVTPGIGVLPFSEMGRAASFLEIRELAANVLGGINVVAALVLIDGVNTRNPTREIAHWFDFLEAEKINKSVPKSLVLTKLDGTGPRPDVQALTRNHWFDHVFQTSAHDNTGISSLVRHILDDIKWPEEEQTEADAARTAVILAVRHLSDTLCALIAKNPNTLRHIHWRHLEEVIAAALESIGFAVELTPPSKDGGKDVIATCRVDNKEHVFYVEIKHWREGGRPGAKHVSNFIEVNLKDKTDGGLLLSSSGYSKSAYGRLAEIAQQNIKLGESEKIVSLCQHFVRSRESCWVPQAPLPTVLFEKTLENT
jgi:hypothetical protein